MNKNKTQLNFMIVHPAQNPHSHLQAFYHHSTSTRPPPCICVCNNRRNHLRTLLLLQWGHQCSINNI